MVITFVGLVWHMIRSFRHDMLRQFGKVDGRFGGINRQFEGIDRRFDAIDRRFDGIDRRFDEISENFRDIRGRLDGLAAGHHGLTRELSELRVEMRARLDESARPAAG